MSKTPLRELLQSLYGHLSSNKLPLSRRQVQGVEAGAKKAHSKRAKQYKLNGKGRRKPALYLEAISHQKWGQTARDPGIPHALLSVTVLMKYCHRFGLNTRYPISVELVAPFPPPRHAGPKVGAEMGD